MREMENVKYKRVHCQVSCVAKDISAESFFPMYLQRLDNSQCLKSQHRKTKKIRKQNLNLSLSGIYGHQKSADAAEHEHEHAAA